MGRFLTLMMVMAVVASGQATNVKTIEELNGLNWRDMLEVKKTIFITGALVGSDAEDVLQNVSRITRQHHRGTVADVVRELNSFYDVVANLPIPVWTALVYAHMKLDGAPKEALDVLVRNARLVVAAK